MRGFKRCSEFCALRKQKLPPLRGSSLAMICSYRHDRVEKIRRAHFSDREKWRARDQNPIHSDFYFLI
jgi:hypothetical protein